MSKVLRSLHKRINTIISCIPIELYSFFLNYYTNSRKLISSQRSMIISYNSSPNTLLAELCDKYGSDKGSNKNDNHPYPWTPHTYTDYYSMMLSSKKNTIKNVFECGIGTNDPSLASSMSQTGKPGASLRVWRDFFPNANIIGADIDKEILFEEERIQTLWIDQTSPKAIRDFFEKANIASFDLMIDDGLHTFEAAKCLFENSISQLDDEGMYIIEDLDFNDMKKFEEYAKSLKKFHIETIFLFQERKFLSGNNLICIQKQHS